MSSTLLNGPSQYIRNSGDREQCISPRADRVARWFGIDPARRDHPPEMFIEGSTASLAAPGEITLITGPSGSGKSTFLQSLLRSSKRPSLDLRQLDPPDRMLVDCFGRMKLERVLLQLGQVGLGEAWTYLRTPSQLSEGQHWRLKLALVLARSQRPRRAPVILCDEFCAPLDRVTAAIVARCLRRAIDHDPRLSALVATSHDDLLKSLRPDWLVHCDFGKVCIHSGRVGMAHHGNAK